MTALRLAHASGMTVARGLARSTGIDGGPNAWLPPCSFPLANQPGRSGLSHGYDALFW